jgi:hypothetical protein
MMNCARSLLLPVRALIPVRMSMCERLAVQYVPKKQFEGRNEGVFDARTVKMLWEQYGSPVNR